VARALQGTARETVAVGRPLRGFRWRRPLRPAVREVRGRAARCRGDRRIHAIHRAKTDWYATYRDGNGERDYWHADVYGLYGLDVGGRPAVAIDVSLARADAGSRTADYAHVRPSRCGGARDGYYVRAFGTREGAAMQPTEFAVMAFPTGPSEAVMLLCWEDPSPDRGYS